MQKKKIKLSINANIHIKNELIFVGFYGISTFAGYLIPNRFLCK